MNLWRQLKSPFNHLRWVSLVESFTLLYFSIPMLLFLGFWTKYWIGLPLILSLVVSISSYTLKREQCNSPLGLKLLPHLFALVVAIATPALLGVGPFGLHSADYEYRSKGFVRDLIEKPWPVIYNGEDYSRAPFAKTLNGKIQSNAEGRTLICVATSPLLYGIEAGSRVLLQDGTNVIVDTLSETCLVLAGAPQLHRNDGTVVEFTPERRLEAIPKWGMSYSFGMFLVPAAIGKFTNWKFAIYSLYIWTVFGIFLGFEWFFIAIGRESSIAVLVLMFFGGLDLFAIWIRTGNLPALTDHLEWWIGHKVFAYESNLANVHWSTQHLISGWILTLLLYEWTLRRNNRAYAGVPFALTLLWSPLIGIGTLPILAISAKRGIRDYFSSVNILSALPILILLWVFYSRPTGLIPSGWIWNFYDFRTILPKIAVFCVVEFLVLAVALAPYFHKNSSISSTDRVLWYATLLLLSIIPFYFLGWSNDFSLRVCIAPLTLMALYGVRALYWYRDSNRPLPLFLLSLLFCLNSFTGLTEVNRAIQSVRKNGFLSLTQPEQGIYVNSVADGTLSMKHQYMKSIDSFFFKNLAPQ
jgi:hypothetical protein